MQFGILLTHTSIRRGYFLEFLKLGGNIIWYQRSVGKNTGKKMENDVSHTRTSLQNIWSAHIMADILTDLQSLNRQYNLSCNSPLFMLKMLLLLRTIVCAHVKKSTLDIHSNTKQRISICLQQFLRWISHQILQSLRCHVSLLAFGIQTNSFSGPYCLEEWQALKTNK